MTLHRRMTPDPMCHGDDPCICEELHAARKHELQLLERWIRAQFPDPILGVQKILARVQETP